MVNNASLSGTNTGDMSLGTNKNGLSLAGQVLSMGTASTSTTGALTNTDWNTFNSKLSSIGIGTTVSSATAGSVFFAGTGGVLQQDNANFFWDDAANRLGIGRTAPGYTLDITGNFRMSNTQPVFGAAIITVPATGTMVLGTGGTNQIAYWSDANTLTGVTAGANSFLTTNGSNVPGLTTIASDTFTQYALLAGRGTGQLLYGGTNPSANLTLASTSNGTKGKILFGTSGYDEVNNRLGLGMTNPAYTLDITGTFRLSTTAPVFGAYTLNMVNNASLSGTNTGDMSLGTNQNGLSLAGQVLSMGTASTSTTGALTNTDWNTFNSKLSSIGIGTTVSSATAGSVFFAGTGGVLQQDNPNFFWDDAANRLGIGRTAPGYTLDINGNFRMSNTQPVFGAAIITVPATGTMVLGTGGTNRDRLLVRR